MEFIAYLIKNLLDWAIAGAAVRTRVIERLDDFVIADDAKSSTGFSWIRLFLYDNRIRCQIFTIRRIGNWQLAELAGSTRLTKLAMNGETFVTGARRSSAGSDFEPIIGTSMTKYTATQSTVMATDENGETWLTALTVADRSVRQPLICRLDPLQV